MRRGMICSRLAQAEAGIEIAFPQRDIHARSVRHGIPLTLRDEVTTGDGQE